MRIALFLAVSTVLSAQVGCASVTVRRVGGPADDNSEGVRFYRPRPYIAVHEPFVVAAETFVASGILSDDGKYVVLTAVPAGLRERTALHPDGNVRIPAARVRVPQSSAVPGTVQGAEPIPDEPTPPSTGTESTSTTDPSAEPADADQPKRETGQRRLVVRNDNSAFAVQPTRRYFDIVYLPDFEENYVVSSKAALGNANTDITLGQGWSLQGLTAQIDNATLTERFHSLIQDAQQALTSIGRTSLGLPPTGSGPQGGAPLGADQRLEAGTSVSMKVTVARVAAPGLYKILKPTEIAALLVNPSDTVGTDARRRILLPHPPFTDIAFNTYEVIVFEAVPVAGDSPYAWQIPAISPAPTERSAGRSPTQDAPPSLEQYEKELQAWLSSSHAGITGTLHRTSEPKRIGLRLRGDPGTTLDEEKRKAILDSVNELLQSSNLTAELVP